MSDDETGDTGEPGVSEWTRAWLEERAAESGIPPDDLLARFAAAFRAAEEGEVPEVVLRADLEELEAAVTDLETSFDRLDADVAALDADLDEKIQDVRERVIQVKREADAKAPTDHSHPDLVEQLETALDAATTAEAAVEEVSASVDRLDDRLAAGFENYEEILEYLTDAIDDVEAKNTRLASAVLAMREAMQGVTARESRRIAADRLREQANTHGIRTADCEDCNATLDVALLADARCPHCASTFASVQPRRGFFGSPTLEVGERPALEAGDAPDVAGAELADMAADGDGRDSTGERLTSLVPAMETNDGTDPDGESDIRPGSASRNDEDETDA